VGPKAHAWVHCAALLGWAESRASAVGQEAHVVACYDPRHGHNENRQVLPLGLDAVHLGELAVVRIALAGPSRAFLRGCDDLEIFRGKPLILKGGQAFRVGHRRDHHGYCEDLPHLEVAWVASRCLAIEEPRMLDAKEVARRCHYAWSHSKLAAGLD
jgi:hypothetical protein